MNSKNSTFTYRLIIFLIFPIIAFSQSVRKIHFKEQFWIVLFFALFFSYTFIPIPDSDATRYNEVFVSVNNYGLANYWADIKGMYDGSGSYQDAYIYTIQLLVSPLTNDIRVYRLVFGFIYFYTFLSLIRHMVLGSKEVGIKFNWFLLGIIFIVSFTAGINGIRWPLALMVFLLGAYRYITTTRLGFLFLACLSALIHFIFFYSVIFLLVFYFTNKYYNAKVTALVVLGVFFAGTFIASGVKSSTQFVGKGVEEKSLVYIENDNWKEERLEGFQRINWYVQLQRTAPSLFVLLALVITTYFGYNLRMTPLTVRLQYFAFISFLASSVSARLVVAADNRFVVVSVATGFIYLYNLYNENLENTLMNILKNIYIPIAILTILVNLRADLYTVSPNLIFGNIFTEYFYRFDQSIQDLLGL